mmetsp:Transcript_36162/g.110919  ORF Transcript_36162/g.110919 Transcript_36162/m.110919 type:complete len:354 (+) Transcript_36162:176-1237(+)
MRSLAFLTTAFATTTWALERTVAPRSEQFDEPPNAALVRRRLAEVERGVEAARSNGRRRRPVDDAPGALQDWFAADSAPSRLFDTNDDITADECADLVHAEGCYESTPNWNVKLDDDVAIDAPSDPASCRTCGYGQRIFDVSAVYDCQTCEDGAEIVVFYDDCTGVCADPALRDYLVDKGLATLETSACVARTHCYDDDTVAGMPLGTRNDKFPGAFSYSYDHADWHDITARCQDLTVAWAVCAIDNDITFDDDLFTVEEDDDEIAISVFDSCETIQRAKVFKDACKNPLPVCDIEYHRYVECLYDATALHASGGELECELACVPGEHRVSGASGVAPPAAEVVALLLFFCVL